MIQRHKGISIFRLPSKKKVELAEWRSQLERLILNIVHRKKSGVFLLTMIKSYGHLNVCF